MRTLTAILATLLLVGTVAAGTGAPSVEPSFAPVPAVRPSVRPDLPSPPSVIEDGALGVPPLRPSRPVAVVPSPPLRTVREEPDRREQSDRQRVAGTASWYCGNGSPCTRGYPGGLYAAAGPKLRVGDWRGRLVVVSGAGRSVVVRLIDWCACPGGRVLDLYSDAFRRLAPLSAGLVKVTVR